MDYAKRTSFFNRLYIFLIVNYSLISQFVTHTDTTGYFLLFMTVLVTIINSKAIIKLQSSKPILFWTLWCIFAFLNYHLRFNHVSSMSLVGSIRSIFFPLVTMTIVAKEYIDDQNGTIRWCLVSLLCYIVFGYVFDPYILYRDLGEENSLGNEYAITTSIGLFFLVLFKEKSRMKAWLFLTIAILIIIVLAMSGTRKAFGAGLIMLAFWAISILNIKKIWTWIIVGGLVFSASVGVDRLMENTFMGQRMRFLEEQQAEVALPSNAPKFLNLFGDRASHYYYGWQIFTEHPFIGVGTSQSRVGATYIHSEYIAQLADNGIVGFLLFFLLYYFIGKKLIRNIKYEKQYTICLIGGFAAILFLSLTMWTWNYSVLFSSLGILVGHILKTENELY